MNALRSARSGRESPQPTSLARWQKWGHVILAWSSHGRTITNDADNVVAWFHLRGIFKEGDRLLYLDTEGRWDEILVRDGLFHAFAPIGSTTPDDAIRRALQRPAEWTPRSQ